MKFEKTGATEVESNPLDVVWILCAFAEMFWSFAFLFFFCEFGEMVTNQFDQFDDELPQCNWYRFSMEMQQLYLMFIINTQTPTNIRGFGNLLCTRAVFKTVLDSLEIFKLNSQIHWKRFGLLFLRV